jgi:hypothetical protein
MALAVKRPTPRHHDALAHGTRGPIASARRELASHVRLSDHGRERHRQARTSQGRAGAAEDGYTSLEKDSHCCYDSLIGVQDSLTFVRKLNACYSGVWRIERATLFFHVLGRHEI